MFSVQNHWSRSTLTGSMLVTVSVWTVTSVIRLASPRLQNIQFVAHHCLRGGPRRTRTTLEPPFRSEIRRVDPILLPCKAKWRMIRITNQNHNRRHRGGCLDTTIVIFLSPSPPTSPHCRLVFCYKISTSIRSVRYLDRSLRRPLLLTRLS